MTPPLTAEGQPAFHRTSLANPVASQGGVQIRNAIRKEDDLGRTCDHRGSPPGRAPVVGLRRRLAGAEPLKLHPENPHYVVFRGKPTVLVASTEHYGAVLNRDFDFRPYLDELKAAGLN